MESTGLENRVGNESLQDVSNIFGLSNRRTMCLILGLERIEEEQQAGKGILGIIFGQTRIEADLQAEVWNSMLDVSLRSGEKSDLKVKIWKSEA